MKCEGCPLKGSTEHCLGLDRPAVCGHVKMEVSLNDSRQRYWHDRVMGVRAKTVNKILHVPAPQEDNGPKIDKHRQYSEKELVISRYNEDLAWLNQVEGMNITVYNKGSSVELPENVAVYHLDNRGREADTMLSHIVNHYDSLAEWTYFVQGAPHNSSIEDFLGRLVVPYKDTTSLTEEYMPDFPSDEIKARDIVEWHEGYEVRYGLVNPEIPEWCEAANLPTETVWNTFFLGEVPEPFYFGYAAQFAVPKHRILDRPLSYWEYLWGKVHNAGSRLEKDPFSAWALEMVWVYLFDKQYEVKTGDFSNERLSICRSCEFYNEERFACNRCGCSFKKVLYDRAKSCPLNKWGV